jgi:type VI secretion system lysozyme-like protein
MKAGLIDVLRGKFQSDLKIAEVDEELHQLLSISDNIGLLLNAREGGTRIDPRYGLPDIYEMQRRAPASSEELRHAIAKNLQRFEPRLRKIRVNEVESEQQPRPLLYVIAAELPDRRQVSFQAAFHTGKPAKVQLLSW